MTIEEDGAMMSTTIATMIALPCSLAFFASWVSSGHTTYNDLYGTIAICATIIAYAIAVLTVVVSRS